MITVKRKVDLSKTISYLEKSKNSLNLTNLERYGEEGVAALAAATPTDSGKTAMSWTYAVNRKPGRVTISFYNTNIQNGVPIAIIIQYGHATKNGGWVNGQDYINPSIKNTLDKIAEYAWKEVTNK